MYQQDETFDSRERKKSKYLSYPYINLGAGHKDSPAKTEDTQTPIYSHQVEVGSVEAHNHYNACPTTAKSSKKRFRSSWCRKFIRWDTMSSSQEFINATSSELLFGLYAKAVDCNFPHKKRKSDLVEWFFSSFRISTFHNEAELAASLIDEKIGNLGTTIQNDSLNVNSEQGKRKKNSEQVRRRKNKSLPSKSDRNKSIAASEFLSECSRKMNNTRPGEILEEVRATFYLQNFRSTVHEGSSRSKCSSIPKASEVLDCLSSEGVGTRKIKEMETSFDKPRTNFFSNSLDRGEESNKRSSFVIDLQMESPPRKGSPEKTNGENKVELDLVGSNPGLSASQSDFAGDLDNVFSSENAPPKHSKTKLMTIIPDLNDSGIENSSTQKKLEGDKVISPMLKSKHSQTMSQEPKSELPRSIYAGTEFIQTINYSKMEVNGDAQGTCLLLQFHPGVSLPSKDDLLATFCQFGPLNVPETQILKDGQAQIVFLKSADAGEAFRNLKDNKPFVATLIDCKFDDLSETVAPIKQCEMNVGHSGSKSLHCDRPSLDFIRQNLQMMASTLEKKGHTISPEMRNKLEGEIKNLMEKMNSFG